MPKFRFYSIYVDQKKFHRWVVENTIFVRSYHNIVTFRWQRRQIRSRHPWYRREMVTANQFVTGVNGTGDPFSSPVSVTLVTSLLLMSLPYLRKCWRNLREFPESTNLKYRKCDNHGLRGNRFMKNLKPQIMWHYPPLSFRSLLLIISCESNV